MSTHTPDAYITRHELEDEPDPSFNACAEGECLHIHCDNEDCRAIMDDYSETGFCAACVAEFEKSRAQICARFVAWFKRTFLK